MRNEFGERVNFVMVEIVRSSNILAAFLSFAFNLTFPSDMKVSRDMWYKLSDDISSSLVISYMFCKLLVISEIPGAAADDDAPLLLVERKLLEEEDVGTDSHW